MKMRPSGAKSRASTQPGGFAAYVGLVHSDMVYPRVAECRFERFCFAINFAETARLAAYFAGKA